MEDRGQSLSESLGRSRVATVECAHGLGAPVPFGAGPERPTVERAPKPAPPLDAGGTHSRSEAGAVNAAADRNASPTCNAGRFAGRTVPMRRFNRFEVSGCGLQLSSLASSLKDVSNKVQ